MTEQQQSQRKRLVVTGGGTGMGRAIAGVFAAGGEQVVLVGRREGVLAEAAVQLQAEAPGGRVV